jgi:hypothetical protein
LTASILGNEMLFLKDRYIVYISFFIPFWLIAQCVLNYSIRKSVFYTQKTDENFEKLKDD